MTAFGFALAAIASLAIGALTTARSKSPRAARAVALGAASAALLAGVLAVVSASGEPTSEPLGVDGISAPFLPFTAALLLVALLTTPTASLRPSFAATTLLSGVALLGFFVAREPLLVWALWTCAGLPAYIDLRGRSSSREASLVARAYAGYSVASSLFVAIGLGLAALGPSLRVWALPVLLFGILVRKGVLPFQSWVPAFFEEAPLGTVSVFAQAHLGGYLLVRLIASGRFDVPTAFLDALGIATALYGALLASVQPTARRALGYFSLSQSALVFTGIAEGGVVGVGGGVLMIFGTGLAQAGFIAAVDCLEARRGSLRLDRPSGGHDRTPGLAGAFLFLGLASVGLPGTLGFVAEDLVFHAALEHRAWVGVGMVLATALNGINVLRLFLALFGGARRPDGEPDLIRRERVALVGLAVTLLLLGFVPRPLLGSVEGALAGLGHPDETAMHVP